MSYRSVDIILGIRGIGSSDFPTPISARAKMGEGLFAMEKTYQGYDVKRIHVGGDYVVVQNQDFRGRKIGGPITHEIKTGHSKLSARAKNQVRAA